MNNNIISTKFSSKTYIQLDVIQIYFIVID